MKHLSIGLLVWSLALGALSGGTPPAISPDRAIVALDELGVYAVG